MDQRASPRMVPSPAAFTPPVWEPGRRESEPRESGLRLPDLDPRPLEPRSPWGSDPQSPSVPFRQEQQAQQRAQKERPPRRDRVSSSGSGSGSGEGVVGGCQGFPPQRPTSERGLSVMPVGKRQGGSDHPLRPPVLSIAQAAHTPALHLESSAHSAD